MTRPKWSSANTSSFHKTCFSVILVLHAYFYVYMCEKLMIIDKTTEYSVISLKIQYFSGAPSFKAVGIAFLP